ncbi:unnamed protein product [Amoebophrya sp. A25]|nr:unnamed protein product [Amoebophrya sp. A25]|eukprot:GSA25T00019052001.1
MNIRTEMRQLVYREMRQSLAALIRVAGTCRKPPQWRACSRDRGRGLESWDVSSVTDISYMFSNTEVHFDPPRGLGRWDVSSVRDMSGVFRNATAMTGGGISAWNVANVTSMFHIFSGASRFNEPNLGKWNVAAVERFDGAFHAATQFAQPLNDWDLSKAFEVWRNERRARDCGSPFPPLSLTFDSFIFYVWCDIYSYDPEDACKLSRALWPRDPTKKTTEGRIAVSPTSRTSAS